MNIVDKIYFPVSSSVTYVYDSRGTYLADYDERLPYIEGKRMADLLADTLNRIPVLEAENEGLKMQIAEIICRNPKRKHKHFLRTIWSRLLDIVWDIL